MIKKGNFHYTHKVQAEVIDWDAWFAVCGLQKCLLNSKSWWKDTFFPLDIHHNISKQIFKFFKMEGWTVILNLNLLNRILKKSY